MIVLVLAVLGLVFGSFVNALAWRLHEQDKLAGKKGAAARKKRRELSIATGRSMCPNCGHELATKDLVPVLSWLWLRGKCRYCRAKIPDSPLVELSTGLLFALSYALWPLEFQGVGLFQFILWLAFLVAFVALTVYDLRWFLLPNRVVYPVIGLATAQTIITAMWLHSLNAIWQPLLGAALIFGLFWVLFQASKGSWIGGGDVKLALALGLIAGSPLRAFLVVFFASLLGTLVSIPLLMKGKQGLKLQIPFGPYLLLAAIIVQLFGEHIVSWYRHVLLV